MDTQDSFEARGRLSQYVYWVSACLLAGTLLWNAQAGDWVDCLYLLGLGIGGALLISARASEPPSEVGWALPALRWTGIVLVTLIFLLQLILLVRFLLVG